MADPGGDAGKQHARLQKLIEANQALAQVESLTELLPELLRLAQDVTNGTASSILLYEPKRKVLKFALAMNEQQEIAESIMGSGLELQMGEGIAGTVAKTLEPVVVEDACNDPRFYKKADDATGFTTKTLMCVPIVYKGDLLGVAQVLNPKNQGCFTQNDLEILISFAHLAAVALVRARLLDVLLEQERMQAQLHAAAKIQKAFLPKLPELEGDTNVWAASQPAIHVGGDLYDCIALPEDRIVCYVADVAGKGLPASLVGAAVWARMRSLSALEISPGKLLSALNSILLEEMDNSLFVTVCLAVYDLNTNQVCIANGGHVAPRVVTNGESFELPVKVAMPLGIQAHVEYADYSFILEKGQSLLLVSDGIDEARNGSREFFGEQRITNVCRENGTAPYGKALLQAVEAWQRNVAVNDDRTILEIWRSVGS